MAWRRAADPENRRGPGAAPTLAALVARGSASLSSAAPLPGMRGLTLAAPYSGPQGKQPLHKRVFPTADSRLHRFQRWHGLWARVQTGVRAGRVSVQALIPG